MIAAALIMGTVLLGLRWPGLLLAAVFFGFPVGLFSGMSWLTMVAAAFGIATMILGFTTRRQPFLLTSMDLLFTLFLVLTLFSATWSPGPVGLSGALAPLAPIIAVALLIRLVFAFGDPDNRLAEFFYGSMVLGAACALYVISLSDGATNRFKLGDMNNIAVGITQALELACLVACAYAISSRGWLRGLGVVVAGLTGQALLITGTRGALLAVLAGLVFYLVRLFGVRRLAAAALLAGPVLLLLGSVLVDPARIDAFSDVRVLNFSSYGSSEDASSAIRLLIFAEAWRLFVENPIWGIGLGGFEAITSAPYPHNIELELLTNTGLAGFALVMAIVVPTAATMADPRFETPLRCCLLAILFSAVCHHQISFSLASGKALYLFLALPVLLREFRRREVAEPVVA